MGRLIDFFEKAYNVFEDQKHMVFQGTDACIGFLFFGGFYGEYFEFTGWN